MHVLCMLGVGAN